MLAVLPARVDSSTTGQCWTDSERWGPLGGSIVFGSWSRCALFYALVHDAGDGRFPNGFVVRFPWGLKSAPMRPRVSPADGQVYVAAQRGWDSIAQLDGAIYRIRRTDQPCYYICGATATSHGIRLSFPCEIDGGSLRAENFTTVRESDRKKEAPPKPQAVASVTLVDTKTIEVEIPEIGEETVEHRTNIDPKTGAKQVQVNPAISLKLQLNATDGTAIQQTVHATINSLPSP